MHAQLGVHVRLRRRGCPADDLFNNSSGFRAHEAGDVDGCRGRGGAWLVLGPLVSRTHAVAGNREGVGAAGLHCCVHVSEHKCSSLRGDLTGCVSTRRR